jgi:hypothetical protein
VKFAASPAPGCTNAFNPTSAFTATLAFEGTGGFRESGGFGRSGHFEKTPIQSARFSGSTPFVSKDRAADEESVMVWTIAGIGLAVLVLILLGFLLIAFIRRRNSETLEGSPASDSLECTTHFEGINENEEFVDYINPLEFSGAGYSSASGFASASEE